MLVCEHATAVAAVAESAAPRLGLAALLCEHASASLPADFTYTTIQLNMNYAAKLHAYTNNRGPSFITGLGDYTYLERD